MQRPAQFNWLLLTIALAIASAVRTPNAAAVVIEAGPDTPPEMVGVGIEEQLGAKLPLDLLFRDQDGLPTTLGKYVNGKRPVLLSLNYSNCPMLCGRQLNDLVYTLKQMPWNAGQEFDVVSVSIDPTERPERAKQTHKRYTEEYDRPGTADGWHFLVGNKKNIEKLADTVGFRYKFIPDRNEFAHAATLIVVTPDGVVSRYINGVGYDPQTLRLSMVEAGDGKIGSTLDHILLTCYVYDETKGKYGPQARRIMSLGGAVTVVILGLTLAPYWLLHRKSHRAAESQPSSEPPTATEQTTEH